MVTITSSSVVVAGWLLLLLRALRILVIGLLLMLVGWGCGGKGRRRPTTAAAPIDAYPRLPSGRSGCSDADAVGTAPVQLQRGPDLRASARRRRWCRMGYALGGGVSIRQQGMTWVRSDDATLRRRALEYILFRRRRAAARSDGRTCIT